MKSNDTFIDDTIHVNSEEELVNSINNATESIVITFDCDVTLTETLCISANKNITLISNGKNACFKLIETQAVTTIVVNNKGVLILENIIVTHDYGYRGMGIDVLSGGKLVMTGGEISNNNGGNGGVRVQKGGFFELSDGKISDNGAVSAGGGVYNVGIFKMYGGEISNNSAIWGGGVWNNGAFTMSGGKISYNNAVSNGGVYNSGTFNKYGGEIFDNTGDDVSK
ncbi:MAG: hypothetical protein FWB84_07535 [Candidatus Bathyarchaeota archaeon]|uniref:hypothetical protein n=1 Tax=Candidatus Bathycorpusculum sp. TaxID=2994959 RepID=UPI0028261EA7|nr:hypothetical protein [Candidatus Termiticorpusculum sp.]MCL2258051.1 hypothetical protein [Candidatus Termiticorpusculum sp.]MCL2291711.1 hypothetical protein [Candidatus Termiticorpusculum sp.]